MFETPSGVPAPHAGQEQVLNLPGRYRVAVCGRRFGKTVAAAIAALRRCKAARARVWWIAPVQAQAERVERDIVEWLGADVQPPKRVLTSRKKESDDDEPAANWEYRRADHALVYLPHNSRLEFHSAHIPDRLRGAGLDLVVIDEAADVSERAWKQVVMPMLLESRGEAFIIGTPRGKQHWLHTIFLRGQDPQQQQRYASIRLPSNANPRLDAEEIEACRGDMADEEFRQEYEAEFIDGVNSPFTKIDQAITGAPLDRGRPGEKYITGIDLGRKVDFTVLCSVGYRSRRAEGFSRFNLMDWSDQFERMKDHLRRFPGPCIVDAGGIGDPLYESIRSFHADAHEKLITGSNKGPLIQRLSVDLSNGSLKLADYRELLDELRAFTIVRNPNDTSRAKYGAPTGLHDDCVMALALAWWGFNAGIVPASTGNVFRNGFFAS